MIVANKNFKKIVEKKRSKLKLMNRCENEL